LLTQTPNEQKLLVKHATHERPLTPQVCVEDSWHTPAASQHPVAQVDCPHFTWP
jgi:hypothetical protein